MSHCLPAPDGVNTHARADLLHRFIRLDMLETMFPDRFTNDANLRVFREAHAISDGVMASLTRFSDSRAIDRIRDAWLIFIQRSERTYRIWQDAWIDFEDYLLRGE